MADGCPTARAGGSDVAAWEGGGRTVLLDPPDEVRRTRHRVRRKPMPGQRWRLVQEYEGRPLHPGRGEFSLRCERPPDGLVTLEASPVAASHSPGSLSC